MTSCNSSEWIFNYQFYFHMDPLMDIKVHQDPLRSDHTITLWSKLIMNRDHWSKMIKRGKYGNFNNKSFDYTVRMAFN